MMKRIVMTLLVLAVTSVPVYAQYNIDTSNVDKALKGEYGS